MMFDRDNPLNRIKGERPKPHQAFMDYVDMGEDRSLPKLARKYKQSTKTVPTKQLSRLKIWSTRFKWQARLAQHQANAQAVRQAELDTEFTERRKMQAKLELDAARALHERGIAIIKTLPLVKSKATDDKGAAYTIEPASSREYNAARAMIMDGSRLARLALGLPQESVKKLEVDGTNTIVVKFGNQDDDHSPEAAQGTTED
jgi:hypothetical protein